ncbi:hypothetical protein [Pyrobaculum sp.]|uniref:hypothetical protein n=1 Tax=Pyrobaculum sp. TaxID=2004705 RepID=UPI003D140AF6
MPNRRRAEALVGVLRISTAQCHVIEVRPRRVEVDLAAVCSTGRPIKVAELTVRRRAEVRFVPTSARAEGGVKAAGTVAVVLRGPCVYEIPMYCLVDVPPGNCARPMVLVPGFDAPLEIEPGTYDLYLAGGCAAEGEGAVEIAVELTAVC